MHSHRDPSAGVSFSVPGQPPPGRGVDALRFFWSVAPGPQFLQALRAGGCRNCSHVRGWMQGGSLVCASALARWMRASSVDAGLWGVATDESEADHVLASYRLWEVEWFVDASGVFSRPALHARLARDFPYDQTELVPWSRVNRARLGIPFDAELVPLLAEALTGSLGPFSPPSLTLGATYTPAASS